MTRKQWQIIELMEQHGDLNTNEVAQGLSIGYKYARRLLKELTERGELTVRGKGMLLYSRNRSRAA